MENKVIEVLVDVDQVDAKGESVCTLLTFSGPDDDREYNFETGGKTEEGWSFTGHTIRINPDDHSLLQWQVTTRARDCDGRMDDYANLVAPISTITKFRAAWDYADRTQRDYSAESMNY